MDLGKDEKAVAVSEYLQILVGHQEGEPVRLSTERLRERPLIDKASINELNNKLETKEG